MIKGPTTTGPPSTSNGKAGTNCFLACFGFSRKREKQPKDIKVNSRSRRRRWFFKLTSLKFKKPATVKTVPVVKADTKWEIQVVEEEAKLTKKWTDSVKRQNGTKGSKGSYHTRRKEMKLDLPAKKSVRISQSMEISSPLQPSTHSIPLRPTKGKKPLSALSAVTKSADRDRAGGGVLDKSHKTRQEIDSIYGMSIILVILIVMMLWGKLCAILCTSSWFFIAPRLGPVRGRSVVATTENRLLESNNQLELESMEYKKKVVLEGLLQRNNNRNIVGRSTRL